MMHIAFFSPGWPLERFHNGIVTFVYWMREELQRLGHRVSVFVPQSACLSVEAGIYPVAASPLNNAWRRVARRFGGGSGGDDLWSWGKVLGASIRDVHRRQPIDLIEMEESFGWFRDVEAITGIPVLAKLHGPAFLSLVEHELDTTFGQERIEREGIALRSARAVAAPALDTLKRTVERYGLEPPIQAHITNPIDIGAPLPRWRRDAGPARLLFVGRFDKRKGGDIALDAFARLAVDWPDLTLTFVGPDRGLLAADGTEIRFEEHCRQSFGADVRAKIDFRGHQSPAEIAALRSSAAAVIVASRWENQGYTLIEAMQQGCPVVASNVGGNPESVVHRQTGLLFDSGQAADLAFQLSHLLADNDMARSLGEAARQYVMAHHAAPRVARESLALYQTVIEQRN